MSDPRRDRIYVAMGSAAQKFPDSIVVLDPTTTKVVTTSPVGPNPTSLAISDDGSTLWVGLHDTSSVRKVDLSGDLVVPGAEYVLPPGDYAPRPHAARSMVVLPGTTASLAVTLHIDNLSPSLVGVVLLDEGVPRSLRLPGHIGASYLARGPSGYLLGFDGSLSFYSIVVSADGLTQTAHSNLISGLDADIVYDSNLVFVAGGAIVNVQNPEAPFVTGHLPLQGPIFPQVAAGVAWTLNGAQSHAYPAALSLDKLELQTSSVLSSTELGTEILLPRSLIRSTQGVFAFIADDPEQTSTGFEYTSGVYLVQLSQGG